MNSIPTTTLCMYLFGCDLSPDPLCRRAIYCSYEKSARSVCCSLDPPRLFHAIRRALLPGRLGACKDPSDR